MARILVVDDSAFFRELLTEILSEAGHEVEAASSGEEAFERCIKDPPALVVSDVIMGALSGVQLCRLLRADPSTAHLPVILLSAADDPRSRFWGRNAGAAAYLSKEETEEALLPEVERILSSPSKRSLPAANAPKSRSAPMELLSQVMEGLLFQATVSGEVRRLLDQAPDRRRFARASLSLAAEIASYAYAVMKLSGPNGTTYALHARAGWPKAPAIETFAACRIPNTAEIELDILADGPESDALLTTGEPIVFPIEAAGERFGEILAFGGKRRLGEEDRRTLALFAGELAVVVKVVFLMEETRRLARIDPLTGLLNRRSFLERLLAELERGQRGGAPLATILCDVDHFKQINDRLGHNTGDAVLRGVARTLEQQLRKIDVLGRWGGEEFVILLPGTGEGAAKLVAERLRRAVEEGCALEEAELQKLDARRVTISLGVAALRGESSTEELIDRADRAMYRAKHLGRNRVELAD